MSPRSKSIIKKARNICVKTRRSWSVREKLMVVHYFECVQNVAATARKFDIERKQVRDWRSKKQELLNATPYLLILNRGRPAMYPLLEESLVKWIEAIRKKQMAITRNMVVTRAKALVKTKEIKNLYSNINNFRFSSS
ncbi:39397_t:CDS:1, partial [Gigaspora margarita]